MQIRQLEEQVDWKERKVLICCMSDWYVLDFKNDHLRQLDWSRSCILRSFSGPAIFSINQGDRIEFLLCNSEFDFQRLDAIDGECRRYSDFQILGKYACYAHSQDDQIYAKAISLEDGSVLSTVARDWPVGFFVDKDEAYYTNVVEGRIQFAPFSTSKLDTTSLPLSKEINAVFGCYFSPNRQNAIVFVEENDIEWSVRLGTAGADRWDLLADGPVVDSCMSVHKNSAAWWSINNEQQMCLWSFNFQTLRCVALKTSKNYSVEPSPATPFFSIDGSLVAAAAFNEKTLASELLIFDIASGKESSFAIDNSVISAVAIF